MNWHGRINAVLWDDLEQIEVEMRRVVSVVSMGDDETAVDRGAPPFWNMINGPLSDALTHVGQVNAWRRLADNPSPRVDLFWGTSLEEE